ncbi:acetyltransferase [Frankia torreyi]|uniref:Acetyltransferase n=1 Tax=Frankia torreyi TaxID=1856 RepID=A0A0D8BEY6_9ACTN|nr:MULTISPECIES: N-acetyltransferase [Frankia]KJE22554.1 acetyltransferase [Frankia torreyi]KQM04595.1 acetyltransferase [Frankia sp. CpI1-P]
MGSFPTIIRQVQEKDLAALAALDEMIFGHLAYPYFVLRQIFDVHRGELLVLEQAGGMRGYSVAVRSTTRGLAWFLGLGVEPDSRGRGFGRRLADASLDRLRAQGLDRVRLTVDGENAAAVRLYRRLGFVRLGEIADYLGPDEPRQLLELALNPVDRDRHTAPAVGGQRDPLDPRAEKFRSNAEPIAE